MRTLIPVMLMAAGICQASEPVIELKVDDSYVINHTLSQAELTAKFGGDNANAVMGRTQFQRHVIYSYDFLQTARGTVPRLHVEYLNDPQVVYIASDYAEVSCEYSVILAHELQHWEYNIRITHELADRVRELEADKDYPVIGESTQLVQSLLSEYAKTDLQTLRKYEAKLDERTNGKIDQPKKYRDLTLQCHGFH